MKEFKDKIAVITGAASGIGFGIAKRCAQEGMKTVLADINQEDLARAEKALSSTGAEILSVHTDVSKIENIEALAKMTLDTFGAVHLLFNNAGVGVHGVLWESTANDWEWAMGVNLWSVIHGARIFIPIMLEQDTECHVVNTASMAGLISYHPSPTYLVTKHGVVALSEYLYHELAQKETKVKISVLCPGWVKTQILESERNRPAELRNESAELSPELAAMVEELRKGSEDGMLPEQVADHVFDAIRAEKFYIITHPDWMHMAKTRMEDILNERNPTSIAG
jgi:short-subunit dehydrogenase